MILAGMLMTVAAAAQASQPEGSMSTTTTTTTDDKVTHTDAEWKQLLTPDQYAVLRQHSTERAFTGPYWDAHEKNVVYVCAGCGKKLFSGETKFDSGTGWPSFYQPIDDKAVGTSQDNSFFSRRTEVHCSRCGGHLGHVFDDGPKPTGMRYCINGTALKQEPAPAKP
jgi:peptide-methionine (R)-S-oxide reductase